ncbi:MAG TPA: hydrogenase maturation nickel metallochaperone HypA [Terriglobia bacterium]|nr:hydrogenase maturation nickel metallochaperone HypA [Terriglobia bacterium]
MAAVRAGLGQDIMHELSIADSIIETVRAETAKHPGARAVKVGLRIGALAGVDPDALSFGFEALVRGTDLEPLALGVEYVPRTQRCPKCGLIFPAEDFSIQCPKCGELETIFAGGDELQIAYLELEEAEPKLTEIPKA